VPPACGLVLGSLDFLGTFGPGRREEGLGSPGPRHRPLSEEIAALEEADRERVGATQGSVRVRVGGRVREEVREMSRQCGALRTSCVTCADWW